jgi:RNA polymerase-associated protein CTR9
LKKSYEFFTIALRQNSKCTLAVNGLAVVLAESGMITEARDLFGQVREASSTIPGAWINLAHAYAALGQSMEAVNMYETCARRFPSMASDPQLWLCAANQLYRAARTENDPRMMKRAIRYVQKVMILLI